MAGFLIKTTVTIPPGRSAYCTPHANVLHANVLHHALPCSWPDPPDDLTTEILVDGDVARHALAERAELLLVVRCV